MRERERERVSVYVCVCVREREGESVCVCLCSCVCVCACVPVSADMSLRYASGLISIYPHSVLFRWRSRDPRLCGRASAADASRTQHGCNGLFVSIYSSPATSQ